jgi:LCP family protein required for cell wall assembly
MSDDLPAAQPANPAAEQARAVSQPGETAAEPGETGALAKVQLAVEKPEEVKPRKRFKRLILVMGILTGVSVLLCGGLAGGLWLYAGSVDDELKRDDAFAGINELARPVKAAPEALNILVLGSDSRAMRDEPENGDGARADTIILVHIPSARDTAQFISIPRDTYVAIPGGGDNKINSALSKGGTPLMVQAVEAFTKVRIDHVVMIDFYGFKSVIDAIGGIDIQVPKTFKSVHPPYRQFTEGVQHMTGEVALDYSRQRYQFADGDFSRIENQQEVIKAVMDKAVSRGLLTDMPKLNAFIRATANSMTVDQEFSLFDLAFELRQLRKQNLVFMTCPSRGTGNAGGQSVVFPDQVKAAELFAAVNADAVGAWLYANPTAYQ